MEYTRPYLYPKQEQAFFHNLRYELCEASTKSGKTVAAIAWILEQAFGGKSGNDYWWVAPVSTQAEIAYRRIKSNLTVGSFTSKDAPTPIISLINGARISFKSADNPDSLFGEDVYAAVIDEASRCKEESWHALRSTITATQGPVRIIGNVKGRRNWFYNLARLAEAEGASANMHYSKITVIDAIKAGVIPQSEVEDARRTLPESVFRELYMAEPSDDAGNPFGPKHIAACIGAISSDIPVAFGLDLAKKNDYLVLIGLDTNGQTCSFDRWKEIPWRQSIRRIHDIVGEDVPCLVDSTGIGDPILEELQYEHGNFSGYNFSLISKQRLMEGLAVSIQSHEIGFPNGPIVQELNSFEYEFTRSGVRYTAPEGLHDDCVCALALAREQWSTTAPGQSMMTYYASRAKEIQKELKSETNNETKLLDREMMTWINSSPSREEVTTNELTELYQSTLAQYQPELTHCFRCGAKLGLTRVSDGINSWHPECKVH